MIWRVGFTLEKRTGKLNRDKEVYFFSWRGKKIKLQLTKPKIFGILMKMRLFKEETVLVILKNLNYDIIF